MNDWLRGRPETGEFAPYASAYIDLVPGDDVIQALAAQVKATESLLADIDERTASTRSYAPGKWTVKQIVGHVTDTERIFGYRALCVSRNDPRPLPGFDQDDYVRAAGANNRRLSDLLDELASVRASTILLFGSADRETWRRRGIVNGFDVTMRGLAFHVAGHELHHVRILREKYLEQWPAE